MNPDFHIVSRRIDDQLAESAAELELSPSEWAAMIADFGAVENAIGAASASAANQQDRQRPPANKS
jgi:hypothetical protein